MIRLLNSTKSQKRAGKREGTRELLEKQRIACQNRGLRMGWILGFGRASTQGGFREGGGPESSQKGGVRFFPGLIPFVVSAGE